MREAAECRSRRSKRSDLSNYSRAEGDYIQQIRLSQHCSDTSMFHFDKRKHLKDFHCTGPSHERNCSVCHARTGFVWKIVDLYGSTLTDATIPFMGPGCMNVSRVNIFKGKLLARGPVGGYVQLLGLA